MKVPRPVNPRNVASIFLEINFAMIPAGLAPAPAAQTGARCHLTVACGDDRMRSSRAMIDSQSEGQLRPGEPHARQSGSIETACGLDAAAMQTLPQRWEAISFDGRCSERSSASLAPTN